MSRSISEVQRPILTPDKPHMGRLSWDEYRSEPRMNPSTLTHGLRGMANDPYAVKLAWEDGEETRAAATQDRMDRGTLAHLMILEPHTVEERVAIWKGKVRSGGDWDAFNADNADKLIVRACDYHEVQEGAMRASGIKQVRDLLAGCEIETSLFWCERSIRMKGRVDAVSGSSPLGITRIVDLKTTNRIDELATIRTIQSMHYRHKMALYRRAVSLIRGVKTDDVRCFDVFVQLEKPYGVNITQLGSDGLDWAEKRMLNLIGEVERCINSGIWNPLVIQAAFGMTAWEESERDQLDMGDDE